jgi:hypothetical protein
MKQTLTSRNVLLVPFTAFLFLGIVSFVFCQETRAVAVSAEKEVAIQNQDVAAARTMALQLATRDAVEKAFGVYIKIEELPDARRVLAQTAAGLKYQILAEQQRGSKYWVKIEAQVNIPAEYVNSEPREHEQIGERMKYYVQKYPQGEVNWGEGLVLAYGHGKITATDPNAEDMAARAAETEARAGMLEIINDIPLDARGRIGEDKRISFAIEGFVQGADVVARSKSGTTVNVTLQAPLRGVKGLTMTVFGYYTPEAPATTPPAANPPATNPPATTPPATKPPATTPPAQTETQMSQMPHADSYTGLVIDARKTNASPAVFPQIQDTAGNQVYTAQAVNKDDLQKRGMASYAVVSRDASISRLFPQAMIIQATYLPEGSAQPPKRRQGYKPLTVQATDASGAIKANLIVSKEDAEKIKVIAAKTGALKECRVVVVVSSEVGGLEGYLLFPL